jgi:hypothetical protein
MLDDERALARILEEAPAVLSYLDRDELQRYQCSFLVIDWNGEARWTAVLNAQAGGLVNPVLWSTRGWLTVAFGWRIHALHVSDGSLAWRFEGEWNGPAVALILGECEETLLVAAEFEVAALDGLGRLRWQYNHVGDVIIDVKLREGLLEVHEWENLRFYLDPASGQRVDAPVA